MAFFSKICVTSTVTRSLTILGGGASFQAHLYVRFTSTGGSYLGITFLGWGGGGGGGGVSSTSFLRCFVSHFCAAFAGSRFD